MCLTILGQIIYGALLLGALALTLGAIFTPQWRQITQTSGGPTEASTASGAPAVESTTSGVYTEEGIFTCKYDKNQPLSPECTELFKGPWWQSVLGVCLILAVIVEAVAVVWTVISFFACFCKQHILHPLSGFAVFAFLLLLSINLVYFFVYTKDFPFFSVPSEWSDKEHFKSMSTLGYSYYLCVGAMGLALFGAVVGAITACFADKGI